nr:transposase [Paenibacillus monticola]
MYNPLSMDPLGLPMDLEEDIPSHHLVRVVNTAVNRLDDTIFSAAYPGGDRDNYHAKMLTKVIIYAYTQRLYSSRQMAKTVREYIPFMWLAGRPGHYGSKTKTGQSPITRRLAHFFCF